MILEEQLAQIYQEIFQCIQAMIPEPWERLVLYDEMGDGIGGPFYFYYYQPGTITPFRSIEIILRFPKEKKRLDPINHTLFNLFQKLRQVFIDHGQQPWTNLTMWLESTGKFKIDYNYDDLSEHDFKVDQIIWTYETLGLQRNDDFFQKYLDAYVQLRSQGFSRQEALIAVAAPLIHFGEDEPQPFDPTDFIHLLERDISPAIDTQLCIDEIIGNANWQIDLQQGTITFDNQQSFFIQVLGTESQHDNTWLWGWANTVSDIPKDLLFDAHMLQAFGKRQHIPELTTAQVPLTLTFNGHAVGSIASVECEAFAYYRCPYTGGALLVTLHKGGFLGEEVHPILRIKAIFPQVIAKYPTLNPRHMLVGHLEYYGLSVEETETAVACIDAKGNRLTALFDAQGRLTKME